MEIIFLSVILVAMLVNLVILLKFSGKNNYDADMEINHKLEDYSRRLDSFEKSFKEEFLTSRMENSESMRINRTENQNTIIGFQSAINDKLDTMGKNIQDSITKNMTGFGDSVSSKFDTVTKSIADTMGQQNRAIHDSFLEISQNNDAKLGQMRDAVEKNQASSTETLTKFDESLAIKIENLIKTTREILDKQKESMQNSFMEILSSNEKKLEQVRLTVDEKLQVTQKNLMDFQGAISGRFDSLVKSTNDTLNNQKESLQKSLKDIEIANEKKLEEMRLTVDEKLQSTLEKRLSTSFEQVSKQLEAVQKGLGTMQSLASDVGGLKRALTNVKNAGTFGEVRLEALLSDVLSPEQFEKNVHPNPSDSKKVVEFAVKIPSKNSENEFIYLPIDSKYPATVWDNLTQAYEKGDKDEIEDYRKALAADVKKFAKDIHDKYIESPYTTEFGVMFLPFEGLYSEVIRIAGLFSYIQETYHVTIAGPTTLNAFLNSLQMGFRTLAIQKESSKVWEILGNVKTQFGKFGEVLAKTKEKLVAATKEIENAEHRSDIIEKKLNKIGDLDKPDSELMLE